MPEWYQRFGMWVFGEAQYARGWQLVWPALVIAWALLGAVVPPAKGR